MKLHFYLLQTNIIQNNPKNVISGGVNADFSNYYH